MRRAFDFRSFRKGFSAAAAGMGLIFTVCSLVAEPASASTYKIIHSFGATTTDGWFPDAALVMDDKGNLYGTTSGGGAYSSSSGTAFELSPPATIGGAWKQTVLYNFGASTTDGQNPNAALIFDVKGNLYGTTVNGGSCLVTSYGCGTVFELSPPATAGGKWRETLLHSFRGLGTDGRYPFAALIMDAKGNLYGTTQAGGAQYVGSVYELSPPATTGGAWKETLLHSFGASMDGKYPFAALILDAKGNLYGTTQIGGPSCVFFPKEGCGTAFELSPPATTGGAWRETILHSFGASSTDGRNPNAALTMDAKGYLYGTTDGGGSCLASSLGCGTAFELSPPATTGGTWKVTTLHNFGASSKDGHAPNAGLIIDAKGNLYGTTASGGSCLVNTVGGCGTAFELSPPATSGEAWKETLLHSFGAASTTDGQQPEAALIMDGKGNLYGTTYYGGSCPVTSSGCGMLFEVTP